jgi:hypothetical protein
MTFDLELTFEKLGQAWHVSAKWLFKSFNLSLKSDPVALSRIELDSLCANVRGAHLQKLLNEATGGMVHRPDRAALCLDHRFELSLDAGPGHFTILDGNISLQRLQISHPADDTIVSAASVAKAQDIAVGVHKSTNLSLLTTGHLKVAISYKNAIPQLWLYGSTYLRVLNDKTSVARIPCEAVSVVPGSTEARWSFLSTGDFFRLVTPHASFDVDIASDGATARPIEAVCRRARKSCQHELIRFDADFRVHSSTIAVPGADRTRFDFGARHLRVVLERSYRNPPLEVMWTEDFALAEPSAPLVLNLDAASLRLWRGCDLFCLTFHFRDAELFVGNTSYIEGQRGPAKPTLIAEFPPQHIMERTFLRQNIELPDAGKPASPADLRQLQRLSVAEGKDLRINIQAKKKSAESKELLGFDCTTPAPVPVPAAPARAGPAPAPAAPAGPVPGPAPTCTTASAGTTLPFGEFANDWDGDKKPRSNGKTLVELYGQWIGPEGLFTLEARREARRFAVQRRGGERDRLINSTGPLVAKDRAVAAEMLALTAFPLSKKEALDYLSLTAKLPADAPFETKRDRLFEYAGTRDQNFKDIQDTAKKKEVLNGRPLLTPDWPISKDDWATIFGPQLPPSEADDDLRAMLRWQRASESDTLHEGQNPDDVPEGFKRPVEAWIAEPSRLAFRIGTARIPLSVDDLTSWDQFELRVTQRATRLYSDKVPSRGREKLESDPGLILRSQGLESSGNTSAAHRMDVIRNTLVPPTELETALEIPSRLILSPAQDARWGTPRSLPSNVAVWNPAEGAPIPVWQARLVEKFKAPSLRAVWSPDFVKGVFDTDPAKCQPAPDMWEQPKGSGKRYRTALSPFDRAELVALSSVYGLPVIASEDKERSSQIATPEG